MIVAPQHPVAIARFGPEDFMHDLVDRGIVWMNATGHFASLTGDMERSDPDEGLMRRYSPDNSKVTAKVPGRTGSVTIPLNLAGPLRVWRNADRNRAIYSLFAIPSFHHPIDRRCFALGRWMVLFHDGMEFVRRVCAAAEVLGHQLAFRPVAYVSDRHSGAMDLFMKPAKFQHQNEWRLATREPVSDGKLVIKVGPLHDIATLVSFTSVP